jgi:O-antigen ligase
MSRSATSLGSLCISTFVVIAFFLANMLRLNWIATLSLLGTLGALGVALLSTADVGELVASVGRSTDFTGRTDIWGKVWTILEEHPWLGMGYGSIWFPAPGTESIHAAMLGLPHWLPSHAHNGFLQIASELGLPIAILAILFLFQVCIEPIALSSQRASPFVLFVIGLQCMFLVSNLFEALLFINRSFHWILFIAVPVALLRATQPPWVTGRN